MDPLSISVGVLGILQAVTSCLKAVKKHVGPSTMSSSETESLKRSLYEFHGAMRSFQVHLELHDDDDDRIDSLAYLKPVVARSLESLQIVKSYIASGRADKAFRGVKFDKKLKASLKSLDDASKLFSMAVLADQQTIMVEVNTFVKGINEDLKDVQTTQRSIQRDNLYTQVLAWLGARGDNDMNSQLHERNLSTRHGGSGKWFLSHSAFQSWLCTKQQGKPSKLWVRGSPGTGKSLLCSTAIEHVSTNLQGICLYHFYRFDDQSGVGSGGDDARVRIAALLVHQLFRYFWQQDQRIAGPVAAYVMSVDKTITSITEVARLILHHGHQYAEEQGAISDTDRTRVFLFLDGLDESKDARAVSDILGLFDKLEQKLPLIQKIWVSSRETYVLGQYLGQWPSINGDDLAEGDVHDFLAGAVPKFGGETNMEAVDGKPLDDWIMEKLRTRAKSNFLYAKLMVEWLKEEVVTIHDITGLITSRVPDKIAEMYRRTFLQYQSDQHKYISLAFSLIAFAKRPLRLRELQEAMTLALSDSTKGLDPLKTPMSLQRLFAPLIETQDDPNEPENPFCRLCHSTVLEFLNANPNVLQIGAANQASFSHIISASRIGDLCLRYLSLKRYSTLMKLPPNRCGEPLALSYDDSRQHCLLPYCAKFWVRHLDDVPLTREIHNAVRDFLRSPNFQALLQAQSLFVVAQFTQFRMTEGDGVSRPMHRQAFPKWYGQDPDSLKELYIEKYNKDRLDYRHFVLEWGYFLESSTCGVSGLGNCVAGHFWGEVDRCLTSLLGPTHFMSHMKEKYTSFMLTNSGFGYHDVQSKRVFVSEAVSVSNSKFMVMSSSSVNPTEVSLETWDLSDPSPRTVLERLVPVRGISLNPECSHPIIFSQSGSSFILGSTELYKQGSESAILLNDQRADRKFESLSVDFDIRDDIVVVASRNVYKRTEVKSQVKTSNYSDIDSSDDEDDDIDDGYPSTSEDNSAYETYSEGSTEWNHSDDGMSDEESEDDASTESSDDVHQESESEDSEIETEAKPKTMRENMIIVNYKQPEEAKLQLEGDPLKQKVPDRPTYPGLPSRFRDPKDRITAHITIYNTKSGEAIRMFHYERDVPAVLYQSPPVLHPKESLVAWPLGGGDVLFVDYEEKTYFTRAIMPTTRDTRHICMKAHFSPCGGYLHIASIEGRLADRRSPEGNATGGDADKREIILSVFVTTHRLSSRKTTRSPPRFLHRVKLTFGQFSGLSLARLPFTFTWTDDYLYFTVSGTQLNVFRIGLFCPCTSRCPIPVTVPKLPVMLPLSASSREVYYMPPAKPKDGVTPGHKQAVVLMGSYGGCRQRVQLRHPSMGATCRGMGDIPDKELMDYACPAVGFYLEEEKDLGGWVKIGTEEEGERSVGVAETSAGGERFRDGKLTRRIEMFSWGDDVDLEGICDTCNSPLIISSLH